MGLIDIKIKAVYILAFLLALTGAAGVTKGLDISIDENSIYVLKDLSLLKRNADWLEGEVSSLKGNIAEQKELLEELKVTAAMQTESILSMNDQIDELLFYNGMTDVHGPGIMLTVSDNMTDMEIAPNVRIVHDLDIVNILTDLKNAGAEAISVNGKRIIAMSEVVCAGAVLSINDEVVTPAFVIKAIGNINDLMEAVSAEGTYTYRLKNEYNMSISVMPFLDQPLPPYKPYKNETNKLDIRFAEPVGQEGEEQ